VSGGPASGDLAAHRARLRAIIDPVAGSAGYDLEELSVVRMGRHYVVRVLVDRDGGVGLDAVADLARDISAALDEAEAKGGEFIAGEYQLEVSSRGVDRPLTAPRHWRRNVGRLVKVSLDGATVLARVTAADDAGVTLDVAGASRTVAFADLGSGRVEVEFSRLDEIDEDDMVAFADSDDEDDDDVADGGPGAGEDDEYDEEDAP
jgi:ribosome maturation factor RimP